MPHASNPTLRRAAVSLPLPAPTSRQKGLDGVSRIPSLLNDHADGPDDEVDVDVEDVIGEDEYAEQDGEVEAEDGNGKALP